MIKYFFYFVLVVFCSEKLFAQNENNFSIPNYIKYNKNSKASNMKIKKVLEKELDIPDFESFNSVLYCGPNFWTYFKGVTSLRNMSGGNIDFQIPQSDGTVKINKGKLIQTKQDYENVWRQVVENFKGGEIRQLNLSEMKYYWSIIFFDIDEPIFVIEKNELKLIADFSESGELLFLELCN